MGPRRGALTVQDERFWQLVDLLGGVADDASVPRLEAALEAGEAESFLDRVYELVAALLQQCSVPPSHAGDTEEWIAAAVVAAGRTTYESTLATGGLLDPEAWAWSEAEDLLVAGVPGHADTQDGDAMDDDADLDDVTEQLGDELGLTFQWCSSEVPPDVDTSYDPENDRGDDPEHGQVWTDDDEWTRTLALLDGDAEFHRRRAVIAGIGLHVVVRDIDEATLTPWPSDEDVQDVVLTVPVEAVLAAPRREDAYVEAVVTLVSSVVEALQG